MVATSHDDTLSAEGRLAPETPAAMGPRELTDGEGEAVHPLQPELAATALLEMAQMDRLPDEGGAVELSEGGKEVGIVSPEAVEDRLVLVQGQVLTDDLHGEDLAVGELRSGALLSKTLMAKDVDHKVVHQAESGYEEVVQVPVSSNVFRPYPLETPGPGCPNSYHPLPKTCTRG